MGLSLPMMDTQDPSFDEKMVYLRIETLFQNSFDKFLISKIKRCMEA
jgi:hypothetical protein